MGQEKMNLVNESAIKAVGAFGGGIAASGSVCGTLLGGVAMISSLYSRGNLGEKEDPRVWVLSSQFMKQFAELTKPYGGMNCRDIAGVDWKNRAAVKKYYSDPEGGRKICIKLVGDAAYALGKILEQEAAI
ncbi:MAG: C_GCAxxG_C_C family protein [Deltaproteobacteria bacterium]|nr:C_GCAxxG_C_C family protein [Deltaproteobacteria bacterium]